MVSIHSCPSNDSIKGTSGITVDRCTQHLKHRGAIAITRTAGSKGGTEGLVWAASSTAAAVCRYRAVGLLPAGLHIPVPGVSSRAVMPPENTAQQCISRFEQG